MVCVYAFESVFMGVSNAGPNAWMCKWRPVCVCYPMSQTPAVMPGQQQQLTPCCLWQGVSLSVSHVHSDTQCTPWGLGLAFSLFAVVSFFTKQEGESRAENGGWRWNMHIHIKEMNVQSFIKLQKTETVSLSYSFREEVNKDLHIQNPANFYDTCLLSLN